MSVRNFIKYRCLDLSEYLRNKKGKLEGHFLKNKNYTIISNNCWGGWVYRYYGKKYSSPTVGNFIMSSDYLRFIKNLKHYMETDLVFILPDEAHDKEWLKENVPKFGQYPIGRIDDVDVHFLHASGNDQAYSDWNRRKARIDYSRIIVKFSTQNHWTKDQCIDFMNWDFPAENKLFFTTRKIIDTDYEKVFMRDAGLSDTRDEGRFYQKYVNMTKVINGSVDTKDYFT